MALGGTVQELKQRMTYTEALQWFAYRRKHGGIGHSRTHYLLATMAHMYSTSHGGKTELHDFFPAISGKTQDELIEEFCESLMGGTYGE